MKKIVCLISSLVLLALSCITASAAGSSTLNGNTSVTVGSTIELTVNVSGCPDASSIAVSVSCDSGFEIDSGTWLKSGSLTNFDLAKGKGALGGLASPNVNGNLFKLVLKAKTASATAQNVSVNVIAKNGANEIMNITTSKAVKIGCKTHSFGNYGKKDNNSHTRTCSVCGNVETTAHNWNGGTVTKAANCKEAGIKTYTCTSCGATKTENIAKTNNHTWGNYVETKKATCTVAGTSTRSCSTCGKTESIQINATGHSMGTWSQSKAPTCTANGEEKRSCSKCGYTETKATNALGHSFTSPTVTKQPTCTETGIESGKCTRCGQTTTNTVKAKGHKLGKWEETKAATCTENGEQTRKCSACGAAETKATEALGHDFENPTIVKEPTISTTGLKEGKCKRCGETTSEVIPCTAKDETTGTVFEAAEGTFSVGTELKVEEIKSDNPSFESTKNVLMEISGEFKLYDINALLNGAAVQPNGEVNTVFTIPEEYGKNVALYHINADGTYEEIEATVNADGMTISAKLNRLGNYAICKLDATEDDFTDTLPTDEINTDGGNTVLYIIIAIAAVVIIAGGVTAFIVIKKKKADN